MSTLPEGNGTVKFDQQLTDTRQVWRQAVAEVAERATTTLPESTGRIEKAVALVLAGDVEVLGDGTARVASQSNGQTLYHLVNGHCDCKDSPKAPQGWCKHRLAHAIVKRAMPVARERFAQLDQGPPVLPAAPLVTDVSHLCEKFVAPAPGVPPQHIVTIQGKPFVKFAGLLQMAHERGLVSLTADWTYNDGELSLAHAVATFQDGRRFEEAGDASPGNVTKKIGVHFRRVALTRAKARALRDALGIELVAVEELADGE